MSKCTDSNHHACNISPASAVHQSLDEMEFERGIWYAAQTGDLDRVKKLLNDGVQVDILDRAGYTALHYAARNGQLQICKLLLLYKANINATTKSGNATSLQRACTTGHLNVVELLLEHRADCTLQDSDGKTALHRAAESQNVEICKLLVKNCPALKSVKDNRGNVPSNYAKDPQLASLLC